MAESGLPETEQIIISYKDLTDKYPADKTPPVHGHSFPDWEVTDEEKKWAESFLANGDNKQVLENFRPYIGIMGQKGLQLLRDSSSQLTRELLGTLNKDIDEKLLLDFLRSRFQTDAIIYEEAVRGVRNIDSEFWHEDEQFIIARDSLRKTRNAFREMNDFVNKKTDKLDSVRSFAESEHRSWENITIHNENFFREHMQIEKSKSTFANEALGRDSRMIVFWASLNSFVNNLANSPACLAYCQCFP